MHLLLLCLCLPCAPDAAAMARPWDPKQSLEDYILKSIFPRGRSIHDAYRLAA
jgi:hypothetical protein